MCVIIGLAAPAANDFCNMVSGLKVLYFFDNTIPTLAFDSTTREISGITATAGTLKAVYFDRDQATFTSEATAGYNRIFKHSITFSNVGFNSAIRNAFAGWDKCTCLGIIGVLENGQQLQFGVNFDSTVATDEYLYLPKMIDAATRTSGTVLDTDKTNARLTTYSFMNVPNEPIIIGADVDLTAL